MITPPAAAPLALAVTLLLQALPVGPAWLLLWDQPIPPGYRIDQIESSLSVDGGPFTPLLDRRCDTGARFEGVRCWAPVPALTPGTHELRFAARLTVGGAVFDSGPSVPLSVQIVVLLPPSSPTAVPGPTPPPVGR